MTETCPGGLLSNTTLPAGNRFASIAMQSSPGKNTAVPWKLASSDFPKRQPTAVFGTRHEIARVLSAPAVDRSRRSGACFGT
jgi:hypothetical protein